MAADLFELLLTEKLKLNHFKLWLVNESLNVSFQIYIL